MGAEHRRCATHFVCKDITLVLIYFRLDSVFSRFLFSGYIDEPAAHTLWRNVLERPTADEDGRRYDVVYYQDCGMLWNNYCKQAKWS